MITLIPLIRSITLASITLMCAAHQSSAQIERIWLTHRSNEPDKIVVNWQTTAAGPSTVEFGSTDALGNQVIVDDKTTLHHVEIPLKEGEAAHYRVSTGEQRSAVHRIKPYPKDELRVAVVANWQGRPKLDAIVKDDVHLLLTAGDNIPDLHNRCGVGVKDCVKPYSELIDTYPELFRSTPFMPALGNHDREIRPRGEKPPAEPVYDVEATAFRRFFPLPDEGWMWRFDIPRFDVRFIALDLNHIQDQGTTWQTCHPFTKDSEQFKWYDKVSDRRDRRFVVTLHNEKSGHIRARENSQWHRMFSRGTCSITGFGYFAERAEVGGFPYFNTSLSGRGARYADSQSRFIESENNYVLITLVRGGKMLRVEMKSLEGKVLDRSDWPAAKP